MSFKKRLSVVFNKVADGLARGAVGGGLVLGLAGGLALAVAVGPPIFLGMSVMLAGVGIIQGLPLAGVVVGSGVLGEAVGAAIFHKRRKPILAAKAAAKVKAKQPAPKP